MRVTPPHFEPDRIAVLHHAVEQARRRLDLVGHNDTVRSEIAKRVVEGCKRGEVYDQRPKTFKLPMGEKPKAMIPGQRIVVWNDSAFVIDAGLPPNLTVVTTYKRLRP